MTVKQGSVFAGVPRQLADERFDTLVRMPGARIERIVSTGQATPAGEWYDQDWDEWVLVLAGSAAVLVEGEDAPRSLAAGDWLFLPRRARHRVAWTDPAAPTIWLAVHADAG